MTDAIFPLGMYAITPTADGTQPEVAYGIKCMTAGVIHYKTWKGDAFTDTVAAGDVIDVAISHVYSDTTTATVRGYRLN